jgi:F420-dependent oxidoreductase-like protein
MLLGLQVTNFSPRDQGNSFDTVLAVTQACERVGLDSIWIPDHFMFPDAQHPEKEVPIMESYITLAALAASTQRIRLGALVTGVPYRNPALLAKMCATLDVVSHGRVIVGLGAAWHEPEFIAYGWTFPPLKVRMEMLAEAVQVVDRMLTQRPANFQGRHYTVQNAYNDPLPVQKPRPPIMIGGGGERATLKLVAQYADFCNVFGDPETVAHKFDVLRAHCAAVGRPFDQITHCNHADILIARTKSELAAKQQRFASFKGIAGTPDEVVSRLRDYAKVGSQYMTFTLSDDDPVAAVELFGEAVLPAVATL